MNKKLLWIPVGVALLVLLVYEIAKPNPDYGKDFKMTCTRVNETDGGTVTTAVMYFDNSGSMKGYTDFVGYPNAKKSIVSSTGDGLTNLKSQGISNIRVECGATVINNDIKEYLSRLTTGTLLNGAITELDKMIENASEQVSDTSVSIIVTDMILSYGKTELDRRGDKWLNVHNLSDLGSAIYNTVVHVKDKKDMHFLVLQYLSDYNGKYYYNCTENLESPKNIHCDSLMKNRPYYIMVIGKKAALKSIIAKKCFEGYKNMYTSFGLDESDYTEQGFKVEKLGGGGWTAGNNKEKPGCLMTDNNESDAEYKISFAAFGIPTYVSSDYTVGSHSNNIEVTQESKTEYVVKIPPCKNTNEEEAWFTLVSKKMSAWYAEGTVDNDVDISCLKDLESKTFGLKAVMDNIEKAYFPDGRPDDEVGKIKFNMVYHK